MAAVALALVFLHVPQLWALGEWWEYYEKGEELAAAGKYADAAELFGLALENESRERKMARTYGVNFIEYYPNRELGIALYELGMVEEAETYLSRSMKLSPSKRAREYLEMIEDGVVLAPSLSTLEEEPMQEAMQVIEEEPLAAVESVPLSERMVFDGAESLSLELVNPAGEVVRRYRYRRQRAEGMRMDSDESTYEVIDGAGRPVESLRLRGGQRPVVRVEQDNSYLDIIDEGGAVLETRQLRTGARTVMRSDTGPWVMEVLDNRGRVVETRTLRVPERPDIRLAAAELAGVDEEQLSFKLRVQGRDGRLRRASGAYSELAAELSAVAEKFPAAAKETGVASISEPSGPSASWILFSGGTGTVCLALGFGLAGYGGRFVHKLTEGLARTFALRVFEGMWQLMAVVCGVMLVFMGVHFILGIFGFPLFDMVMYYLE